MTSKADDQIEDPMVVIDCDIEEIIEKQTSEQPAEPTKMKLKRRVSLPVSIPLMENNNNIFGNTNKEQKSDKIQLAERGNPGIRHNLPFTPMPVRHSYLRIKNEAEKSSILTHQNSAIKENKRQHGNIQLTKDKMVQTDASGSPRLDDQDKELLKFYKLNKIPPRQILSMIKQSKYFTDVNLNKEVSQGLEQIESQIKIAGEGESNKKVANPEEKEQGIVNKLLELSDNNKQILLKYFENENKTANPEQAEISALTRNNDSAINITNRKEYDDHLRRSILFEIYQLFKRENNMRNIGSKRNASATTQPPPKRATVSSKQTYLPQKRPTANMTTALSYNNIQQCPAPQYGYDLHGNDQAQINTMPTPQEVAPYPVGPRIPTHYQVARFHGEGASLPNPMQMYHMNMQLNANANQLYVRPQEPLQINQQNVQLQMEHQGYRSHANQQHILNEQAKSQREDWRGLQAMQMVEYHRELEQQKLPVFYPNTQWSEYQRRV